MASTSQRKERARCANIVRDRRYLVQRKFMEYCSNHKPTRDQIRSLNRVMDILKDVEYEIQNLELAVKQEAELKVEYPGDFSTEEMELAQAIIAEQEHNPFEG